MLQRLFAPFVLPNPFERSDNDYWRVRLINIYLVLTTFVFSFFTLFNLFVVKLYPNAIADMVGLVFVIGSVLYYRASGRVDITSVLVVANIYLISIAIIIVAPKDYGILFWSIFAPIFSLYLLGRKKGLLYTCGYYAVLIAYLLTQLGSSVSMHLFVEFVIVSLILVAVIYYYELNRSEAYTLVQRAAIEDPLTGVYNRRQFNRLFEEEFRRAEREKRPFIFFIMDIDYFKHYNDSHGHQQGDIALQRIGEALRHHFRRSGDVVFRLGGEEFGGIINPSDDDNYLAYLEQLREAIASLGIEHRTEVAAVMTASFGLSIIHRPGALTPNEIYKRTDEALYRAKQTGRNRIEMVLLSE
jgi:diguanylate cyclase (GGDEF)-like protein